MPLHMSYIPNYYSIDDILATQERIPCKFLLTVPKLGKLNPAVEDVDLKAGTQLELPLWMIQEASLGRQPIVSAELPKVYKENYREILKADPCAVDLHKFGMYFYEVGAYVKFFEQTGDVADALFNCFKTRFRQLMDLANNTSDTDLSVLHKLDALEKKIFKDAYEAKANLNKWLVDSVVPLETANMVLNHKKRKRIDIDEVI